MKDKLHPGVVMETDKPFPQMQKTTIDLPFSPEDVAAGRVDDGKTAEKFDHAWQIILASDELRFARQRLSVHELRHIIRAVAEAFI